MPEKSELTEIPGNIGLSDAEKQRRVAEIYEPFHAAVDDVVKRSAARGHEPVFVTVHSFTPVYKGAERPFELGILHDDDSRLADAMLEEIGEPDGYSARRNEPYGPADGVTHTLNLHSKDNSLLNVMLEIRNDIIADEDGQSKWARRLAGVIEKAVARLSDHIVEQAVATP